MPQRQRLDAELVRRRLADTRSRAAQMIDAGTITVNGSVATKAAHLVHAGEPIEVLDPPRFVSRGGEKLDAALIAFAVEVSGLRILDAGASTGGFSDCLLQRGADHVVALDVGHGQLHPRVRNHPRVTVLERFHIRDVDCDAIGGPVDMVVADLSFISLRGVLRPMISVCRAGGPMVLLVKPQFEAGRAHVSKGRGLVTDPAIHEQICAEVAGALEAHGCVVHAWVPSPITGAEGNREFLVHATTSLSVDT